MSPDPAPRPSEQNETSHAVIERALAGMSAAELLDLRTTARRLKHLPFTRLVEALFSQAAARSQVSGEGGDGVREHDFAGDDTRHCQSEFVRELFRQIERALAAKAKLE